jgi:GH24 family phage-related lysozyme (muramidase)
MSTIRTLISFALWIGAIWLLASRLLRFDAGGDLTEAADDGMAL